MNDALPMTERPLAARGLRSFRYLGRYGFIMIGARDIPDALAQAERSFSDKSKAVIAQLDEYNEETCQYEKARL